MNTDQYRAILKRLELDSRPEAAELLGVHRQAVWLWSMGKRPVPSYIANLLKCIEHLGVEEYRAIIGKEEWK